MSVIISFRSIMSKIRLNVLLCLQAVVKVGTIYLHMGTRDSRTLILLYSIKAGKMKQIVCSDYFVCKEGKMGLSCLLGNVFFTPVKIKLPFCYSCIIFPLDLPVFMYTGL